MKTHRLFAVAISLGLAGIGALAATPDRQGVSFARVVIDDPFWSPRIRQVQEVTVPDLLDLAEEQGKLDNFRIVTGRKAGRYRTNNAADSDATLCAVVTSAGEPWSDFRAIGKTV